MKTIGRANDGGHIVEMSDREYNYLSWLAATVEGKSIDQISLRTPAESIDFVDLGNTFSVIRAWTLARMRLNELQDVLTQFSEALNRDAADV